MKRGSRTSRPAFTLLELLVVVTIIIIASVLTLPAFSRIIQSSNYSAAVNTVTATLANARAQAIRNGRHTGVAFLFDIQTRQFTLQVLELVGQQSAHLSQFAGGNDDCDDDEAAYNATNAQGFSPARGIPPVELPPGTGVYGMSFSVPCEDAMIDSETAHWYAGERVEETTGQETWVWLFPRNDARMFTPLDGQTRIGIDPWPVLLEGAGGMSQGEARAAVRHANSFFVMFTPEGTVSTTTNTGGSNFINAYIEDAGGPLDLEDEAADPWDDAGLFDPDFVASGIGRPERNPEVVLRAVATLAVVDLEEMIAAPNIADPSPWLYRAELSAAPSPQWVDDHLDDAKVRAVSRWIDRNAQILAFNRYTGQVMRRQER